MTVGGSVWPRAAETVRREKPRTSHLRGTVWIVTYLLFILAPLFALLLGSSSARAQLLDRVLGRHRLLRPGDDGACNSA